MIKLLILLIVLLVNTMIINYINGIEKDKCECSTNYSTKFVKYYSLITIILVAIVTTFYTTLGGLPVSIKTDRVQSFFIVWLQKKGQI